MFYDVEPANHPDVETSADKEEQKHNSTPTKDDRSSEEEQNLIGSTKDDRSSEEEQNFIAFAKDDRTSKEDNLSDKRDVAQTVKTLAFRTVLTTPDKFCNKLSCNSIIK